MMESVGVPCASGLVVYDRVGFYACVFLLGRLISALRKVCGLLLVPV